MRFVGMEPCRTKGMGIHQLGRSGMVEMATAVTMGHRIANMVVETRDDRACVVCVYAHSLNGGRTTRSIGEEGDGHILLGCHRYE